MGAVVFQVARKFARYTSAGAVIVAGLVLAAPASAVEFIGFTNGCFGAACVPVANSAASTITLGTTGLSYTNSTFDVTSSGGFAPVGGPPASPNVNNLGSFTLTSASNTYTGNDFTLLVSFTAPPGVSPTSTTFTDLITGSVTAGSGGGVNIAFNTPSQTFSFDGGTFTLSVNNVSLTALAEGSNSIAVSGSILVEAVPEPSTWAMMILGFLGVGFVAYRRRGSSFRFA
jgi:PEP-CTERM motif